MGSRAVYRKQFRSAGYNAGRAIVALSLASACMPGERATPPPSRSIIADVVVSVENHEDRSVMIYVVAGSMHDSLGVVSRHSTRSFSMPSAVGRSPSPLRLEARGDDESARLRSDDFRLSSGHRVLWTIDGGRPGPLTIR